MAIALLTPKEGPMEGPMVCSESAFLGTTDILTSVSLGDGQSDELDRENPVSVGANVCYGSKDFSNQNRGSIADGGGYCNTSKVPCFKTPFYFLVFIGIVAVLTVLAMTGFSLAVLSRSELRKTERKLNHKMKKLSSLISEKYKEVMQSIASVYNTTIYNAVATESQKTNVDDIQTNIRRINDQVNQTIGRILSDLDTIRNITTHLKIMANDASNKVNMLVGKNLISNCTSGKLQCNNFVPDITSTISTAITEVLYLAENRVGQPACYISGGNSTLQMTATLRSDDANSAYCVCIADGNISISITCELHYVQCGIITIN